MPIYEYQCKQCREIFESLQLSRSDVEETECPHCGSEDTERVVSSFATGSGGRGVGVDSGCGPSGSGFR